jgi:hypothetical protein
MFVPEMLLQTTLLGFACLAPRQDAGNDPDLNDASALVQDGSRAARVGVTEVDSQRFWTVVPLTAAADGLREGKSRTLAPAWRFTAFPARVDVLHRADSTWALTQDVHGGATRSLELLEYKGALFDDEQPVAPGTGAADPDADDQPTSRRFTDVTVAGDVGTTSFLDLFAPRLVELGGALHLVGSSLSIEGDREPLTWAAPVPAAGESLLANPIGNGADARLAELGGDHVCLVRALDPRQSLEEGAPIHVYWSKDLATWQPALPIDEETKVADYDVLADLGSLWVAAVVPEPPPADPTSTAPTKPIVRVWRLPSRDDVWQMQSIRFEVDSPTVQVRLLSSSFGAPVPKLVLREGRGTERVIDLPVQ